MNRSMHKVKLTTPRLLGLVIALFVFVLAPQVPIHSRFSQLDIALFGLIALFFVLFARQVAWRGLVIPLPLLLLLVIMGLSITQMPASFIVRDYILFVALTFFAVLAINSTGSQIVINSVAAAGLMMGVTTLLFFMLNPNASFDGAGFRGAFFYSNYLPISLMFTVPSMAALQLSSKKSTLIARTLLVGFMFALIVFSTSRSALLSFTATMLAWLFFAVLRRSVRAALLVLALELAGLVIVILNWSAFTAALGKSADMSGRLPLWDAYWQVIQQRPWTGYGWHFDTLVEMPLGQLIQEKFGLVLVNANNEFLNWWALTGIFGATFAIASIVALIVFGIVFRKRITESKWVFLSGIALLVSGLAEVAIQHPGGWLMLVMSWTSVGVSLRERRSTPLTSAEQRTSQLLFVAVPWAYNSPER